MKKAYYRVKFVSKEFSPFGVVNYSAVTEGTVKELREGFKSFLKEYGFSTKGGTNRGKLVNSKGQEVASFEFCSEVVNVN